MKQTWKNWLPALLITAGCGVFGWIWGSMTASAQTSALSTAVTSIVTLVTAGIAFLGYRRVQDTVAENRATLAQVEKVNPPGGDRTALVTGAIGQLDAATERMSVAGATFGSVLIVAGSAFLWGYHTSTPAPHQAPWQYSAKPKSVDFGYSWLLLQEKLRTMGLAETVVSDLYAAQKDYDLTQQAASAVNIQRMLGTKPDPKPAEQQATSTPTNKESINRASNVQP